jgi:hypothetical protein
MPKKRTISRTMSERLVTLLAEGNHSATDLARENDVSLLAIARWAAQPQHVELLAGLVRLSNVRAQIVLTQYRTSAAAKLIEHAMHGETAETSRKACVDLLKIDLPIFRDETASSTVQSDQSNAPSNAAIRRAFRELAERTEAAMRDSAHHQCQESTAENAQSAENTGNAESAENAESTENEESEEK